MLKFLFECHFSDGSSLKQTQEDVSATVKTKSAFYDVVQRLDDVVSFGLIGEGHTYAVDLIDGHFEIDGLPFNVQDPRTTLDPDAKFRLVYFRKVQRHFNQEFEQQGVEIDYHIGWQTLHNGQNVQYTIAIR
jgi:hypothetical protein